MRKCLIITSYIEGNLHEIATGFDADFIICADGGYDHAAAAGIRPDLLIGDLDSIINPRSSELETIIYPSEKDDTDTGICLQAALDKGYTEILIAGGLGGRFDHTMSNIQLITGKSRPDLRITIKDKGNMCTVLNNSSITLPRVDGQYVSVFSMTPSSSGVTLKGFKYPLENAVLPIGSTLGTSNEITSPYGEISVADGILLAITSDEKRRNK